MLLRLLNTIIILLLIDFFGLLPESAILKLVVDLLIVGSSFYIIIRKKKGLNLTEKFVFKLFGFFFIVAVLTYLKGGSSIMDIYKFFRIYFPLLLVFSLLYDTNYSKDGFLYYRKLTQVIAICITVMLILISVFHVELFASWPRLTYGFQYEDYIPGLKRVYIFSSFTFPILEFIFLVYSLFLGQKVNKYLFALITTGFLLQGFRSYILATILIIALSIFSYLSKQSGFSLVRFLKKNFVILALSSTVGFTFLGSRIASGVSDFINVSGTFGSRILLDAFRLKVFSENPLLGVGFLHNDAERARKMGVTSSKELRSALTDNNSETLQQSAIYSLRATDSGYLDLLIQFGIVGVMVLLILYFSFFFKMGKELSRLVDADNKVYILALRAVLLLLLLTLISHAAITNVYGLLPLAIALAFAQCKIDIEDDAANTGSPKGIVI